MTPLQKAQQALAFFDEFNSDTQKDTEPLFTCPDDTLFELPHDGGQLTLGDLRQLVNDYAELRHRMDGLEK